jgi:hypothetical protein
MSIQRIKSGVIADSAVTAAKLDDSTSQLFGMRNLVYNGAMEVAQRGTSFTATTSDIYTVDRFQWMVPGGGAGFAITQETDAPNGLAKSVKIATTTTGTADLLSIFRQRFEGQDTYHLAYGSSGAKSTTLSFWVKSNITGTFGVAVIQHSTTQRGSYHHYTITAANTWQKVVVNIPGDTGGASIYNQTMECSIDWFLSGVDTGSTPDGTWGARTTNQFLGTGTTELQSSTNNYWQITGVQWEVGDVATPFERRPYGTELALCQRYYEQITGSVSEQRAFATATGFSSTVIRSVHYFKQQKRATPTIVGTTVRVSVGANGTSPTIWLIGPDVAFVEYTTASVAAAGSYAVFNRSGEADFIAFSAEL